MRRTLTLSLLVVSVAVALALASYSALAGSGPVSGVASAVVGSGEGDTITVGDGDGDMDGGAVLAANDVDGDDGDVEGDEEGDEAEGAHEIAGIIADAFGASADDVWAQHEGGIGFGALFKLYALGAPIPTGVDGDHEFNFGELRKALTEEQQTALESGPKNLGQLKKAALQGAGGGSGTADEAASTGLEQAREKFAVRAAEGDGPQGHGPPASVPAHGRN